MQNHQKNSPTNRTDISHFVDVWSLDTLDLKDYGPGNNKGYRYVLVIIEKFSEFGWTAPKKMRVLNY